MNYLPLTAYARPAAVARFASQGVPEHWITKPLRYNASLLGIWFNFDQKWTKVDHGFPRILIILIYDMFISQYSFVIWIVNMISSIWPFIPVKILTCILQRMLICGSRRNQWSHLISSMLGISLVIYCFRYSAIYLILLSINTWTALLIARKHRYQSQGLKNHANHCEASFIYLFFEYFEFWFSRIFQFFVPFYFSFLTFEISRQN